MLWQLAIIHCLTCALIGVIVARFLPTFEGWMLAIAYVILATGVYMHFDRR
jgi:hypothetical protein